MSENSSPIRAIIDLKAFRNNLEIVKNSYPNSRIILPVKANAYGHGDILISREAESAGMDYLAVARTGEGLRLRSAGIRLPVMILGVETGEHIRLSIENDLELSAGSLAVLEDIGRTASRLKASVPVHIKIDTGMGRLGFLTGEIPSLMKFLENNLQIRVKSLYTHFAKSEEDPAFTGLQIERFETVKKLFEQAGIPVDFYSMHNSGAILAGIPAGSRDAVRPGIMVYGYPPDSDLPDNRLVPVMTLKSRVIHIKEVPAGTGISYNHRYITGRASRIATVCGGYGDGIRRTLSNRLRVVINGKEYPQIGTITMDLLMVQVDESVQLGDEAVIFGNKKFGVMDARELGNMIQTISYEITTGITERVPRIPVRE